MPILRVVCIFTMLLVLSIGTAWAQATAELAGRVTDAADILDPAQEAALAAKRFRPAIEPPYRWRDWAAKPEGITGDELIAFVNKIILIQIKGAKRYNARDVVLAEWLKKARLKFYKLGKNHRDLERAWEEVDPGVLFR